MIKQNNNKESFCQGKLLLAKIAKSLIYIGMFLMVQITIFPYKLRNAYLCQHFLAKFYCQKEFSRENLFHFQGGKKFPCRAILNGVKLDEVYTPFSMLENHHSLRVIHISLKHVSNVWKTEIE